MAADEPVQSYYPSARVRLIIRLDDYGADDTPDPPKYPKQLYKGTGTTKESKLTVSNQAGVWQLLGSGDSPNHVGTPHQQASSDDNRTFVIDGVIPSAAKLQYNGMRTASTMTLTIPFVHMPIDPRCVRSVGVQYYLGCVSADDYQRGIAGAVRSDATGNPGQPLHVIPDTYVDPYGQPRTNLRFEGWVDDWESMFPDDDQFDIQLECTDNTRLLLEQDAPTRLSVEADKPIDQAIANYLANFPQFRGLSVMYAPSVDVSKIPILKNAMGKQAAIPGKGPPPAGAGAAGAASKLKVWDYLTDLCGMVGHNIRMVGATVVVQRPRTLYDSRFAGRADDPFVGRQLSSGRVLTRRLWLYGHNLTQMKYKRRFTVNVPRNVEIRSYDTVHKKPIVVRYPPDYSKTTPKKHRRNKGPATEVLRASKRMAKLLPGNQAEQAWWVVTRPDIRDDASARVYAQSLYESQGRNEIQVRLITKNLGSFGGGNLDPDALDMLPGDAIDVEVVRRADGTAVGNTAIDVQAEMMSRPTAFLADLGYSPNFARAYAIAVQSIGLPTTFRVRTVGIDWDMESGGVTIDIEAMNYIEVRNNLDLDASEQITPADVQNAAAAGTTPPRVLVEGAV